VRMCKLLLPATVKQHYTSIKKNAKKPIGLFLQLQALQHFGRGMSVVLSTKLARSWLQTVGRQKKKA